MNYSNEHLMSEVIWGDSHKLEDVWIYLNEVLACDFTSSGRRKEISALAKPKPSALRGYLGQLFLRSPASYINSSGTTDDLCALRRLTKN